MYVIFPQKWQFRLKNENLEISWNSVQEMDFRGDLLFESEIEFFVWFYGDTIWCPRFLDFMKIAVLKLCQLVVY